MTMSSSGEPGRVVIHTDGGAEPNPGRGGWGAVVVDPASGERREISGGEDHTTNNRMELTAALRALETLPAGCSVDLHTDSSYLRLGITQWLPRWKRSGWRLRGGDPVKNDDLWREIESAAARHRVRWHWVKGHSGQEQNERAHELAAAEIRRRRKASPGAGAEQAAPGPPAEVDVLLKLSCVSGKGAWAARVRRGGEETVLGGEASGVTANRLELLAAAALLEALPGGVGIEWRGGSDYLREGASKWLEGWRRRGYRTSAGDQVKNADLWRGLERQLAAKRIRFGPAGDGDAEDLASLERDVKGRLERMR